MFTNLSCEEFALPNLSSLQSPSFAFQNANLMRDEFYHLLMMGYGRISHALSFLQFKEKVQHPGLYGYFL